MTRSGVRRTGRCHCGPLAEVLPALAPLKRLPWGSWQFPSEPTWFYASADRLAFMNLNGTSTGPEPEPLFDLFIGARDPAPLGYVTGLTGIELTSGSD
jgi:hypothetical protein